MSDQDNTNNSKSKKILLLTYIAKVSVEIKDIESACDISWEDVRDIYFDKTNVYLTMEDGGKKYYDMSTEFEEDTEAYHFPEPNSMNVVEE